MLYILRKKHFYLPKNYCYKICIKTSFFLMAAKNAIGKWFMQSLSISTSTRQWAWKTDPNRVFLCANNSVAARNFKNSHFWWVIGFRFYHFFLPKTAWKISNIHHNRRKLNALQDEAFCTSLWQAQKLVCSEYFQCTNIHYNNSYAKKATSIDQTYFPYNFRTVELRTLEEVSPCTEFNSLWSSYMFEIYKAIISNTENIRI